MNFWSEFIVVLARGLIVTLEILSISIPASIILGIILGSLRVYGGKVTSTLSSAVANTFRGLPLIVTLIILFFGLADLKIYLSPFWAATIGFILCGGSYISEYVRTAIYSIEEGQSLAAQSIGMTKFQELIYIILPQAVRRALPAISNEIVYMIKYSSLAFIVGVQEIFSVAKTFNSLYFKSTEIFLTLALIYLILTGIATIIFKIVESKLKIPYS